MAIYMRRGGKRRLWSYRPVLEGLEQRCVPTRFTEIPVPSIDPPWAITTGDDGHVWFTMPYGGNRVGRVNSDGSISEFLVPTQLADPLGICATHGVWVTEGHGNKVAEMSYDGRFVWEFPLDTSSGRPYGITSPFSGLAYFTEIDGNKIGIATDDGLIGEIDVPTDSSGPMGITSGPDGNIWFTEFDGNKLGRMTLFGSHSLEIDEFQVPTPGSQPSELVWQGRDLWFTERAANQLGHARYDSEVGLIWLPAVPLPNQSIYDFPTGITVGPDGRIWFTERSPQANKLGRVNDDGTITEFSLPTAASEPLEITTLNGSLWFTENRAYQIGKLDLTGPNEYALPRPNSAPRDITTGPDGNLWFTESNLNQVGRISPSGAVTEFRVNSQPYGITTTTGPISHVWFTEYGADQVAIVFDPVHGTALHFQLTPGSEPWGIAGGTQDQVWFTEVGANQIGEAGIGGVITEIGVPTPNSFPLGITMGLDGHVWFTEYTGNQLGRVNDDGTISEFPVPTASGHPWGITTGPDGNLWFTESDGNKLGRVDDLVTGQITEFPLPTPSSGPLEIITGPDGKLWFTELLGNRVGTIDPNNPVDIREFAMPTANSHPFGITSGPDGNLWLTEQTGNQIVQFVVGGPGPTPAPPPPLGRSGPIPIGSGEEPVATPGYSRFGNDRPLSGPVTEQRPAAVQTVLGFHAHAAKKHRAQWWQGIEDWSWDVPGLG
jgi:streptogramin lyase